MGIPHPPPSAMFIVGLLGADAGFMDVATAALNEQYGPLDTRSDRVPWTVSAYYAAEMGPALLRQYLSFVQPLPPDRLAAAKLATNALEARWGGPHSRQVNIDPGYLTATKLVLASTKDAAHRIYLGSGIFAEVTLEFQHGSFQAGPHTYPDYAAPEALAFFNAVRATHLRTLRAAAGASPGARI